MQKRSKIRRVANRAAEVATGMSVAMLMGSMVLVAALIHNLRIRHGQEEGRNRRYDSVDF